MEEILGFEPSGEGEHCFLWVEKTDRNSNDVAGEFDGDARTVGGDGAYDPHVAVEDVFVVVVAGLNDLVAWLEF